MIAKLYLSFAAFSGMLAVILGAFAAHGLLDKLPENLFSAFQTGVQYQFYHVLALLLAGVLLRQTPSLAMTLSGGLFIAGMVLFCGSLYGLAMGGPSWLGPVTPLGGLCFILGWALLFLALVRS